MTAGRLKIWNADAGEWEYPPGGGSQPGSVRRIDLGVVTIDDVGTTLYTPTAGELVGAVYLTDLVHLTDGGAFVSLLIADEADSVLAGWDSDLSRDGAGYAANPLTTQQDQALVPLSSTAIRATTGFSGAGDPPFAHPTWEAATAYTGVNQGGYSYIVAAGHMWRNEGNDGTSGNSEPDFAGNFGGTVTDNDITWTDKGVTGDGAAHVYVDVCTPAAP